MSHPSEKEKNVAILEKISTKKQDNYVSPWGKKMAKSVFRSSSSKMKIKWMKYWMTQLQLHR